MKRIVGRKKREEYSLRRIKARFPKNAGLDHPWTRAIVFVLVSAVALAAVGWFLANMVS